MTELDSRTFANAIQGEKPVVVDFWAGWCMPCKLFAPVLEEIADQMDGKADFYKLNVDDAGDIALQYGVSSIPTLIIFQNGAPVNQTTGVQPKESVIALVEKYL